MDAYARKKCIEVKPQPQMHRGRPPFWGPQSSSKQPRKEK